LKKGGESSTEKRLTIGLKNEIDKTKKKRGGTGPSLSRMRKPIGKEETGENGQGDQHNESPNLGCRRIEPGGLTMQNRIQMPKSRSNLDLVQRKEGHGEGGEKIQSGSSPPVQTM